jgi:hypothetical protein
MCGIVDGVMVFNGLSGKSEVARLELEDYFLNEVGKFFGNPFGKPGR